MTVTRPDRIGSTPALSEFEHLVFDLSTRFIRMPPEEISAGIEDALEIVGRFAEVDLAYIFLRLENQQKVDLAYLWQRESVSSTREPTRGLSLRNVPWLARQIMTGQVVNVPDVGMLPPEASADRAFLEDRGVRATLAVPLTAGGEVLGALGFELLDRANRWSEPDAALLKLTGEVIANALTRKLGDEAIRRTREFNRVLIDAFPDLTMRVREDGLVLDFNAAPGFRMYVSPEEAIGKTLSEILPPSVASQAMISIRRSLATRTPQTVETEMPFPEGIRHMEVRHIPVGDREILSIIRDVTERHQTEQFLRQTQRLESVGVLAGGVAHDFNNLLTGIIGQNELALAKLDPDSPVRGHLKKAVAASLRAAGLVRQLLAYAGKTQFRMESVDLNHLISSSRELLESAFPGGGRLELDLAAGLKPIAGDRSEIQQVLMNLVMNAAEALEGRAGRIDVRTFACREGETSAESLFVGNRPPSAAGCVVLEVIDQGQGMDEATLSRIFDPFYSTRSLGRGLGLSAALGIIHAHAGGLQVESAPGEGSRFRVFLPVADLPDDSAPPVQERSPG